MPLLYCSKYYFLKNTVRKIRFQQTKDENLTSETKGILTVGKYEQI